MLTTEAVSPPIFADVARKVLGAGRVNTLHALLFFFAYVTAGGLGQGLAIIPGVAITIWPPAGLLTAVLFKTSSRQWPQWLLVSGLADLTCNVLWFHNAWIFAAIYFAANAIEAMITASLTRRLGIAENVFQSTKNAFVTILIGCLVSPVAGALIIASTDAIIGKHAFGTAFPLTWLGDATGFLAVAPVTVAIITAWENRKSVNPLQFAEAVTVLLLQTAVWVAALQGVLPTIYFTLPLILFAAVRFQLLGASTAIAIALVQTAVSARHLPADLSVDALRAHTVHLQCYLSITAISSILVATLSLQYSNAMAKLKELNESLEERVRRRTAELAASEARLKQADSKKNVFLATLAHELRNPLAAIQSGLELLTLDNLSAAQRASSSGISQRQLQRMIRIVDDLLDVNRIALGKFEIKGTVADLRQIASEAVEACRALANEKSHQLLIRLTDTPLLVEVDTVRLTQVLINLLTNAAKYTSAGGKITVCCIRDSEQAVITITDNGNGIPDHMIDRVFDMFAQIDGQDLREARGGLGIGLALSKAIVELLNGTISVRSEGAGQGSQFEVRLPLTDKPLEDRRKQSRQVVLLN